MDRPREPRITTRDREQLESNPAYQALLQQLQVIEFDLLQNLVDETCDETGNMNSMKIRGYIEAIRRFPEIVVDITKEEEE